MSFSAKILLDSVSETGKRITTFEITFPRCVLAEAETHRVIYGWDTGIDIDLHIKNVGINVDKNLSRNSASSRAIPINKMIDRVKTNPFVPYQWGKPVKGMGAKEYWPVDSREHELLTINWNKALNYAIECASIYSNIGNKEDLNRLLEPFMWHTAIVTATEFDNFFKLRTNEAADWKIRIIADLMYDLYYGNKSLDYKIELGEIQQLKIGEWHTSLIDNEDIRWVDSYLENEFNIEYLVLNYFKYGNKRDSLTAFKYDILKAVSVARCARVSYLTQHGTRDIEENLKLFERLRTSGHWSPFEHVATPYFEHNRSVISSNPNSYNEETKINRKWHNEDYTDLVCGNFYGWKQFRKEFQDENCTNFRKE